MGLSGAPGSLVPRSGAAPWSGSRVVVGFDGSVAATATLRLAAEIADRGRARLEVVGVARRRRLLWGFAALAGLRPAELEEAELAILDCELRAAVRLIPANLPVSHRVVRRGAPGALPKLTDASCDLLVIPAPTRFRAWRRALSPDRLMRRLTGLPE